MFRLSFPWTACFGAYLLVALIIATRTLHSGGGDVEAFVVNPLGTTRRSGGLMATGGGEESVMGIPTIEQLGSDPFPKQVQHAEFICGLIAEDDDRETDVLMKRLRAQLSHADGVRGFMVTYLTMKKDKEDSNIPPALLKVLLELIDPKNDSNELINLMCLNIIMPTAMVTTHKDPELAQQSAITAARAMNLMTAVMDVSGKDSEAREAVTKQCKAILEMATSKDFSVEGDTEAQKYWSRIFEQWGYQETQLGDIANAVRMVLAS